MSCSVELFFLKHFGKSCGNRLIIEPCMYRNHSSAEAMFLLPSICTHLHVSKPPCNMLRQEPKNARAISKLSLQRTHEKMFGSKC